jgi:hypothetical protein
MTSWRKGKSMSEKSRKRTVALALALAAAVVAVASAQPAESTRRLRASPTTSPAISVATVTARDVRAAVVAIRKSGGTIPTAEVRVALARKVDGRWRETGEMRLREAYFWRTASGPRSICRLEIATAGSPTSRGYVAVQLLRSPSLGCGPLHRFALPSR